MKVPWERRLEEILMHKGCRQFGDGATIHMVYQFYISSHHKSSHTFLVLRSQENYNSETSKLIDIQSYLKLLIPRK